MKKKIFGFSSVQCFKNFQMNKSFSAALPPYRITVCVGTLLSPPDNSRSVDATNSGMHNRHTLYVRHAARTVGVWFLRKPVDKSQTRHTNAKL